jgi:hypothetical protein
MGDVLDGVTRYPGRWGVRGNDTVKYAQLPIRSSGVSAYAMSKTCNNMRHFTSIVCTDTMYTPTPVLDCQLDDDNNGACPRDDECVPQSPPTPLIVTTCPKFGELFVQFILFSLRHPPPPLARVLQTDWSAYGAHSPNDASRGLHMDIYRFQSDVSHCH